MPHADMLAAAQVAHVQFAYRSAAYANTISPNVNIIAPEHQPVEGVEFAFSPHSHGTAMLFQPGDFHFYSCVLYYVSGL